MEALTGGIMRRFLTTVLSFFFFGAISQAAVVFAPAVTYSTSSTNDETTSANRKTESRNLGIDLRLGYSMVGGLYIGGIYATENGGTLTETNGTKTEDNVTATRLGVSLGYMTGNFYLLGHYFLSAEESDTDQGGSTTRRTDGSGYQLDAGWAFQISSGVAIGPQIAYKNIVYKKTEAGGTSISKNFTRTGVAPMFSLVVMF